MAIKSKKMIAVLGLVIVLLGATMAVLTVTSKAEGSSETQNVVSEETAGDTSGAEDATGSKALAAGIAIGFAALGGASE